MIALRDLSLRRGTKLLLEQADITIHAGERVGLIGANGTGKSSLFALIRGELSPDSGELELAEGQVIAHVAQESPTGVRPAIEYVLDGDEELRALERQIAEAEQQGDGEQLGRLHARYDAIDGYRARIRAAQLMEGLGFRTEQLEQPLNALSGGWRMRLNLAQALMCRSDILLLDEPTNHLDLDTVIWLEQWLRAYPGTLMLISHDRDFLDAVVTAISHIEQRRITLYKGDYQAFERQRAERLAQQQATHERQKREIAHIQSFVDRFRAKATKARQAQSRLKALARMELVAAVQVSSPFRFQFRPPKDAPHPLMALRRVEVGYDGKAVLRQVELTLQPGDRLGLLGANGAGKSTLIKSISGLLPVIEGEQRLAPTLKIGYFAQHHIEQLRDQESPLEHLMALDSEVSDQEGRDFLGGFDFHGERAVEPIAPFSGGEKARLALALIVWQRPNLLLLDEPTNHLDLQMRDALTLALQEYEGALILVSHDRYLLRATTDRFLLVADGRAAPFEGDLDDYSQWLAGRRGEERREDGEESATSQRDRREQAKPIKNRLKKLDQELARLTERNSALEQKLAAEEIYAAENKTQLDKALSEQATVRKQLSEREEEWLTLSEELEALEG